MYNDPNDPTNTAVLAAQHPDYSANMSLFRMSGTSQATGVASGVAALLLQAHPQLTPDQVKFRLMYSARPAFARTPEGAVEPLYNLFQQGAGRAMQLGLEPIFGTQAAV